MKRGLIRIVLIVISFMILIGAYAMIEAMRSKSDEIIEIDLNALRPEAIKFDSISMLPGEQCEYHIRLHGKSMERYDVHFDFIETETEEKTLKNFARVKILSGEEVLYDELLASALENEDIVFTVDFIRDKNTELSVVYYLPIEVGNEAKNAEAAFELLITATNE